MNLWDFKMQLPNRYCTQDESWLREQFQMLENITGIKNAQAVAIKYSSAYTEIHDSILESHKRDNRARFEANTRLRQLIKRLKEKPIKPTA